jgi:hypothetical protein
MGRADTPLVTVRAHGTRRCGGRDLPRRSDVRAALMQPNTPTSQVYRSCRFAAWACVTSVRCRSDGPVRAMATRALCWETDLTE